MLQPARTPYARNLSNDFPAVPEKSPNDKTMASRTQDDPCPANYDFESPEFARHPRGNQMKSVQATKKHFS